MSTIELSVYVNVNFFFVIVVIFVVVFFFLIFFIAKTHERNEGIKVYLYYIYNNIMYI